MKQKTTELVASRAWNYKKILLIRRITLQKIYLSPGISTCPTGKSEKRYFSFFIFLHDLKITHRAAESVFWVHTIDALLLPLGSNGRQHAYVHITFSGLQVSSTIFGCLGNSVISHPSWSRDSTVEVMELWTVFHEHYSLLDQSSNMGRCISTKNPEEFFNILLIFRVILILLCP